MISVSLNEKEIRRATKLLAIAPKELHVSAAVSVNRTLTHVKATMSKTVRQRYLVKAASVKGSIKTIKASGSNPTGKLESTGSPISLTAFRISVRKRGPVKVKILRSGNLKPVKGLFVNRFPRGYTGPMHRRQPARYPLATPAGPSIPQMIGNESVLSVWEKDAEKYFNERFTHEVDYRFSKLFG